MYREVDFGTGFICGVLIEMMITLIVTSRPYKIVTILEKHVDAEAITPEEWMKLGRLDYSLPETNKE